MARYKPTIGIEVHIELKTKSKMFCSCKNAMGKEKEANINICPVCTAQPGTLPVPNKQAIEFVQMAGLAMHCQIAKKSKFDRKNYFYPDLPKGYQISQYDQPFCEEGYLKINKRKIGITRIHLEEDTGKLVHPPGKNYTLVDFNRAGVPLMELVTEPDFETGKEAKLFCQKLQQICRYLGISDADMEKGNMRCEANVSLYKEGKDKLGGTKVEVKNINSFRFLEKAINYEIDRQKEVLESGGKIIQETRGFDSVKNKTVSQRTKESAHDYRYFPEPDIPGFEFDENYIEDLKRKLPELPQEKSKRFVKEYKISEDNIVILVSQKDLADYFEQVVSEVGAKLNAGEFDCEKEKIIKTTANYLVGELRKMMAKEKKTVKDIKITAENFAELMCFVAQGKINSSAAQLILEEMYRTGGDPSQIIDEKKLAQVSDEGELGGIVEKVLNDNQKSAEDYKAGKENAIKFLMGQVMAATKGSANPQVVMEMLKKKLK